LDYPKGGSEAIVQATTWWVQMGLGKRFEKTKVEHPSSKNGGESVTNER